MTSHSMFVSTAFCLLVIVLGKASAAVVPPPKEGLVSFPLIPSHVELERRRQRRRAEGIGQDDSNNNASSSASGEHQYRRREEAMQVGALYEGYGTHYADLWCGTPPQRQTVIVDTGSGITAFPCSQCSDCGSPQYHVDRLFVEEESSSFSPSYCTGTQDCIMDRSSCSGKTCKVSMSYAEGSRWSAYEAVDKCYIGGPHETPLLPSKGSSLEGDDMNPRHAVDLAFDMTFGCQTVATNLFKTQLADGIMGMSHQSSTYWSQMFTAGKMGSDKQFALCFSRPPTIAREGTEAGMMTLGGYDERIHASPMVFTPHFSSGRKSFFSAKIRKFMLRDGKYGESARSTDSNPNKGVIVLDLDESALNHGGTIVDSGTTDTYFYRGIRDEFNKAYKKLTGREHNNKGQKMTEKEMLALPTILIQLQSDDDTNSHIDDHFHTTGLTGALDPTHKSDVILAIPPSHYMEYNEGSGSYTSRFYPSEGSGNVIGANAMMGHDIFFDIDNQRIGWAESQCDYTNALKHLGYDWEITGELKEAEEAGVATKNEPQKPEASENDAIEEDECQSISSGAKCQKIDGCAWNWGKCAKATAAAPTSDGLSIDDISPLDQKIVAVVAFFFVSCCFYCLFCRPSSYSGYSRTTLDDAVVSLEMTDNADSFKDEPDDDDDDDGSGSSGRFRDEPEFEGDFA